MALRGKTHGVPAPTKVTMMVHGFLQNSVKRMAPIGNMQLSTMLHPELPLLADILKPLAARLKRQPMEKVFGCIVLPMEQVLSTGQAINCVGITVLTVFPMWIVSKFACLPLKWCMCQQGLII